MNHYQEAERLLARAAELEETPRHSIARTLGVLAQGHATLALVKATRQATEHADAVDGLAPARAGWRTALRTLMEGHR